MTKIQQKIEQLELQIVEQKVTREKELLITEMKKIGIEINKTIYNLSNFMNGDIQEMIDALIMAENAEKLNESKLDE